MHQKSFVILSSDDWGWKTSKYQLSMRFARQNRVLFVSSIGFRAPTASRSDVSRIWTKLKAFLRGPRQVEQNIWVLTPLVIPFGRGPLVSWVNRLLFSIQYFLATTFLKIRRPYLFVFSPNWSPYVKSLRREKLIYYAVDEHSEFDGVNSTAFSEWDEKLTHDADHVFCSAELLYRKKKTSNPHTHYMPHGVNWDLFSSALESRVPASPSELQQFEQPVLLFFGHISYDWIDPDLLRHIAAQRPDWQIVLVGRDSTDPAEFATAGNIHLLGEKQHDELPDLCRYAAIGLIPFVNTRLTAACNPLKLYEYLAAGLPVVSTDIPEVRQYADTIFIGKSHAEFLQACDRALQVDRQTYSDTASEMVREHDWDSRVRQIYDLIAA